MKQSRKSQNKRAKTYRNDQAFFESVWDEREHVCAECGVHLGDNMSLYFMAHILSKGAYPSFRHDPRNIVILCPSHHNQMDAQHDGKTRHELKIWEEIEEIREELIREYYDN